MASALTFPARWIDRRAQQRHLQGHRHVAGQRQLALWMTLFSAVRTVVWLLAMAGILAYWLHLALPGLRGFITLSSTVLFVTFISFYCNASTDAANFSASIAALFSADAHHDAESAREALTTNLASVEDDIARLAELNPGPEASALAADIRRRLAPA